MAVYDPALSRLVSDVVASTPLPATLPDLDSDSQRQMRREAEALGITPDAHYAAIRDRQTADRVNASGVDDAVAAVRSRIPSATRSNRA